jgi:hypothetical protein
MAALPAHLERTFVRLWTHCDDEGRCEDRPRLIKAGIYPEHDDMTWEQVDADLSDLHDAGLIARYTVHDKGYIAVVSWDEYQHPQRPTASKFPAPPEPDTSPPTHSSSTGRTRHVRESSATHRGLEKEREREREQERATAPRSKALELVSTNGSSPPVTVSRYPSDFEAWWVLYPRKVAKTAAAKAWKTARGRATFDQLHDGLRRSVATWHTEGRAPDKIPHASTWLNGCRWEDEPPPPAQPPEPKGFTAIRSVFGIQASPA